MRRNNYFKNRQHNLKEQYVYWRNNWRNGIQRLAERVISGRNVSDLLGGNLIQVSHLPSVRRQLAGITLIECGEVRTFSSSSIESPAERIVVEEVVQPVYEISISNLRIDIRSGLAQLEAGFVIDSTLAHWQRLLYRGGLSHSIKLLSRNQNKLSGKWIVLPYSDYYFHTLLEDIPQVIRAYLRHPDLRVLTPSDNPQWTFQLLEMFGIPFVATESRTIEAQEYVAITASRGISENTVELLRGEPREFPRNKQRKIWISRGISLDRADPLLEELVLTCLKEYGFESVDPSALSVNKQKELFSSASVIAGLHGGALSNIVWAQTGCSVIEIFNHEYRTLDFARLSSAAGHRYYSIELSGDVDIKIKIITILNEVKSFVTPK